MSGWELFTWVNAVLLGIGAFGVFVWFLRDLPQLMPPRRRRPPRDGK